MDKGDAPPPYYQPMQPQQPHYANPQPSAPPTSNLNVTVNTGTTVTGTCPVCHAGHFTGTFTLCGWLCCLFCFPCGIICCLCMRKKKCNHCGFATS